MQTRFRLVHGDCLLGMKRLDAESVDVVVTSPPYNLGIDYNKYDDAREEADYLRWTLSWASQVKRILKPNGSLFLNLGGCPSNPMLPHSVTGELRSLFVLQNTIHWIKSITIETKRGELISSGHFKPIRSNRFITDCHEFVFHLTKAGDTTIDRLSVGVPYADKSNIGRWAHTSGKDLRCRGNTWFIPYKTIQNRKSQRPHPATFPKELPMLCIRLHGWRSDLTVMDPFLGIGSSALAAKECDVREFIGFEIDRDYLTTAVDLIGLPHSAITTLSRGAPFSDFRCKPAAAAPR